MVQSVSISIKAWVCDQCERGKYETGTPCIVFSPVHPNCEGAKWEKKVIDLTAECNSFTYML